MYVEFFLTIKDTVILRDVAFWERTKRGGGGGEGAREERAIYIIYKNYPFQY